MKFCCENSLKFHFKYISKFPKINFWNQQTCGGALANLSMLKCCQLRCDKGQKIEWHLRQTKFCLERKHFFLPEIGDRCRIFPLVLIVTSHWFFWTLFACCNGKKIPIKSFSAMLHSYWARISHIELHWALRLTSRHLELQKKFTITLKTVNMKQKPVHMLAFCLSIKKKHLLFHLWNKWNGTNVTQVGKISFYVPMTTNLPCQHHPPLSLISQKLSKDVWPMQF